MTTVTAIQGDGWAVISCDTRITTDNRITTMPSDMSKVVQNGKYLIAVAGKFKVISLMEHIFSPTSPAVTARGKVLDKFITKVFLTELEAFMVKHFPDKPAPKEGEDENENSVGFIVVVNGVVYEIGVEYTWSRESSGKYAIGSGSEFALGVLQTTSITDIESAQELSRYAIERASTLDTNTNDVVQTFTQMARGKK